MPGILTIARSSTLRIIVSWAVVRYQVQCSPQKYASDAVSAAIFANICDAAGVPCQRFVNHSDVAGGSTLGNILASSIPLKGVDMGNAILAMHSCRETGSVNIDHEISREGFHQILISCNKKQRRCVCICDTPSLILYINLFLLSFLILSHSSQIHFFHQ